MSARTTGLLAGGLLALAAGGAQAATLGLAPQAPSVEASGATIDYVELGGGGDLSTFGAAIDFADGVSVGEAELSFGVGVPSAGEASGGFDVVGTDGLLLDGALARVGFVEDSVELEFADLGGSLAQAFGASVLVMVDFDDALGADPFDGLVDGQSYLAAVTVSAVGASEGGGMGPEAPAPIPVPASGLMMLLGLALGGTVLRRRPR